MSHRMTGNTRIHYVNLPTPDRVSCPDKAIVRVMHMQNT